MHIRVGLFEVKETTLQIHGYATSTLLERCGLLHQILAFVNDENTNLIIMATTLYSIIDCECLKILRVYYGTCFGHVMFKAY
jgi:hypothetical protein